MIFKSYYTSTITCHQLKHIEADSYIYEYFQLDICIIMTAVLNFVTL